jgi:ABC-2 type transport system ATP-binding protein
MSPVATLHDVSMRFKEHAALDDVSTAFERDTITGLLGRNGAGKTTLLQLLTGHRVPTRGQVEVLGASPYENDRVLSGICFVKEGQRYPDHFRVRDALDAAALVYPDWDADLAAELLRDFDLPPSGRSRSCPAA